MLRLLGAAALALAATNPLLAQGKGNDHAGKPQSEKGGGKPAHAGKDHGRKLGDRGAGNAARGGHDAGSRKSVAARGGDDGPERARDHADRVSFRDGSRDRQHGGWSGHDDIRGGWIDRAVKE